MNPDQKMEMFKKLNAQAKEVQQAEDQNDAIAEASSQDKIVDLKIKILENLGEKNRDIDTAKSLLGQLKTLDVPISTGVPIVGSNPPALAEAFTEARAFRVASKAFIPCSFALTASTRPSSLAYSALE